MNALAYPELESAVAQLVTAEADPAGWEDVYGRIIAALAEPVAEGRVPRALAVQRITRALGMFTDDEDARWLAEVLPVRGWTRPIPAPLVPANRPPDPPATPADEQPLLVDVCRFGSIKDRLPRGALVSWPKLAERLTRFTVFASKDDAPLWSPVRYKPGTARAKANVAAVSCMVLDFDDGTPWADVLPRWPGVAAAVHTSWSHTEDHPKWRLVMPLRAPVPGPRWGPVWAWAAERGGLTADEKCKDASRIYFVPAVRSEDAPRSAFVLEGAPLEVPLDVIEPVERQPNRVVEDGFRTRGEAAAARGQRGELYRTDPNARRELGVTLGGQVVSNGSAIKGVRCPSCGRPSVSWWVDLGAELQARCNHRQTCGARFWLDQLEGAR